MPTFCRWHLKVIVSVVIIYASTYDEYFGQKIFAIGSKYNTK